MPRVSHELGVDLSKSPRVDQFEQPSPSSIDLEETIPSIPHEKLPLPDFIGKTASSLGFVSDEVIFSMCYPNGIF